MTVFTATFLPIDIAGQPRQLRLNTRLWFSEPSPNHRDLCLGAVVGLNPGSAASLSGETSGQCDATMLRILSSIREAFRQRQRPLPKNAYIQMLNCFYVKEKSAVLARSLRSVTDLLTDPAEETVFPFLWFAWGAGVRASDASRFLTRQEAAFWFDAKGFLHSDSPADCRDVRHPLARTKGLTTKRRGNMIADFLDHLAPAYWQTL